MPLSDCYVKELPKITDPRGNLTFVEGGHHIPFEIRRVFHLYDVPGGAARAGHALDRLQQLLIAMSGSFDISLDDSYAKKIFLLNRSYHGLYLSEEVERFEKAFASSVMGRYGS